MTRVLPDEAYAAALATLPGMGPARLSALLTGRQPSEAWSHVRAGRTWSDADVLRALGPRADDLITRWRKEAESIDVPSVWFESEAAGVGVVLAGSAGYPAPLVGDVEPPAVLFHQGNLDLLSGPRVAIVGTRRCSPTGTSVAFELGRDLSAAGVEVVSGLATGIDGAAHWGVLAAAGHQCPTTPNAVASSGLDGPEAAGPATTAAPPVGVVGSGLDVVYPPRHRDLWAAVARTGLLLSEAPLGARPERWRFPARNRIIAALADLVVVVESHRRGGSLHTVDEADRRGVDVMVVPGSVRNPAATGSNELLAEGRAPVLSVDDVLVALGLGAGSSRPATGTTDRRPHPDPGDLAVLDALGWQPATLDDLVRRTGLALGRLAPALDRLEDAGWLARRGGWHERIPTPRPQEEP
jgi:DNA processing protein